MGQYGSLEHYETAFSHGDRRCENMHVSPQLFSSSCVQVLTSGLGWVYDVDKNFYVRLLLKKEESLYDKAFRVQI